jgi:hypothetical protein
MTVSAAVISGDAVGTEKLCDHEVVLDNQGRLVPWTSYDRIIKGSMEFIKHCPTHPTAFGYDPWYVVSSEFREDGTFKANQNNQGSNAFYAVETAARYYAYSGDRAAFDCARLLLERVLRFHTPEDWAWPRVPRTQDNTPDGEYTDDSSEPDKMAMVGCAYVRFFKLTGEKKYLDAALGIAKTLASHIQDGDETHSPLPFRVNLKTGEVLDGYTANMVAPVMLLDALIEMGHGDYAAKRDTLWRWVLEYPIRNNRWSGYYEDVGHNPENLNQQIPMETARYMLRRPDRAPDFKQHVPALISWVRDRFGKTKRFGATSIREQDGCFKEMSSHTARYASVVARWYGVTGDGADRDEARASFALATYSTFNRYSKDDQALNYVGVGYVAPWFSDSYFDFLSHIMDGMAQLPDLAPADADHMLGSTATVTKITYGPKRIEYETAEPAGNELLRITFAPTVLSGGKKLDPSSWQYGEYHGVPGVLRVNRQNATCIAIEESK